MRQMQIAKELLQSGYTIETFLEDAAGVIKWKHRKEPATTVFIAILYEQEGITAKSKDW